MTITINEEITVTMDDDEPKQDFQDVIPNNVGHLSDEPFEFECPACHQKCQTRVAHEAVTCFQTFIAVLNFCLCCKPIKWEGRHDVNHYCSKCGCYIGRKISLSWSRRKLMKLRNSNFEDSGRWQKFRKVEKKQLDEKKQKYKIDKEEDETQQTQTQ